MSRKSKNYRIRELEYENKRLKARINALPAHLMAQEEAVKRIEYLIGYIDALENTPPAKKDTVIEAMKQIPDAPLPVTESDVLKLHELTDLLIITLLEENKMHDVATAWRNTNTRIQMWGVNSIWNDRPIIETEAEVAE